MKRFIKVTWIFFPLVIAALMYLLLPMFPKFTEYVFSRGLFKLVTTPIGFVTSLLPFSLTEAAVVIALPLLILIIALFVRRMKKSEDKKKTAVKATRCTAGFLSFTLLLYMICHGANFYRQNLAELMQLDTSQKNAEQLAAVCIYLAQQADAEREGLMLDENGCVMLSDSLTATLKRTNNGYIPLVEQYPWLWTAVSRQKPVQLSYWWSYTGITGMYFPFFVECNVNIEQPDYAIPFTAAHESAHARGIAFEDECNFLAFLSCINSEYQEFRYSGYVQAYVFCANALFAHSIDMWSAVQQYVSSDIRRDIASMNEHIDRFDGEVHEISSNVNDTFIKVQGVSDGTLSYNRVTELILAYYFTEK